MTLSERLREIAEYPVWEDAKDILEAASLLESRWRPISDKEGILKCWSGIWICIPAGEGFAVVMSEGCVFPEFGKEFGVFTRAGARTWAICESRVTHWQPVVAPEVPE